MPTRFPGQAQAQTSHNNVKLSSALSSFVFLMPKVFQFYGMFQSDNLEKSDRKNILSENFNEKEGITSDISLFLDLMM